MTRLLNIGCGRAFRVGDLHAHIARSLGSTAPAVHGPPRAGDVRDSCASIDLARELLGYEAAVGFEEGLRRTCDWFTRNPEAARRTR